MCAYWTFFYNWERYICAVQDGQAFLFSVLCFRYFWSLNDHKFYVHAQNSFWILYLMTCYCGFLMYIYVGSPNIICVSLFFYIFIYPLIYMCYVKFQYPTVKINIGRVCCCFIHELFDSEFIILWMLLDKFLFC